MLPPNPSDLALSKNNFILAQRLTGALVMLPCWQSQTCLHADEIAWLALQATPVPAMPLHQAWSARWNGQHFVTIPPRPNAHDSGCSGLTELAGDSETAPPEACAGRQWPMTTR